jgi:ABC-2 type transport system ATP-binding protein
MTSPTDTNLLIEGRGVTKVFKDFWGRPKVVAVHDLDIAVRAGTVLGLLGPNGAGKTTLLKMVLGHLYPSSGTLAVFGRSPRDVETKSRLGYLPERTAFYRMLTAAEVLRLFGDILGLPRNETAHRTDQLLDMVGLQGARDRRVGGFSHGMGRRLGLAQALLNDPDLLILDEPTAGMDPIGCYEMKGLILTLARRGKTVVMSSHLLADVQDVCDTIMIMYGGTVRQTGPVSDLLARKDELEILVPRVSPETLAEARTVLAREAGAENVRVAAPTRSLEDYFLEVMRAANVQKQETAGARMGGGVAAYLQQNVDPKEILDRLTRGRQTQASPAAPPPVDTASIEALTRPAAALPPSNPTPRPEQKVDTDYLKKLTKG